MNGKLGRSRTEEEEWERNFSVGNEERGLLERRMERGSAGGPMESIRRLSSSDRKIQSVAPDSKMKDMMMIFFRNGDFRRDGRAVIGSLRSPC